MTKFEEIKLEINKLVDEMASDAEKFYVKEQKAASVRLRKGYKAIKQYVDGLSKETSSKK
jgi:hypothetical protein